MMAPEIGVPGWRCGCGFLGFADELGAGKCPLCGSSMLVIEAIEQRIIDEERAINLPAAEGRRLRELESAAAAGAKAAGAEPTVAAEFARRVINVGLVRVLEGINVGGAAGELNLRITPGDFMAVEIQMREEGFDFPSSTLASGIARGDA